MRLFPTAPCSSQAEVRPVSRFPPPERSRRWARRPVQHRRRGERRASGSEPGLLARDGLRAGGKRGLHGVQHAVRSLCQIGVAVPQAPCPVLDGGASPRWDVGRARRCAHDRHVHGRRAAAGPSSSRRDVVAHPVERGRARLDRSGGIALALQHRGQPVLLIALARDDQNRRARPLAA